MLHQSCSFHLSFFFLLLGFQPDTSPTLGLQTGRDFPWVEGRERHIWTQDGGVFISCINQVREEQANLHWTTFPLEKVKCVRTHSPDDAVPEESWIPE